MKKLLLLAFLLMVVGCTDKNSDGSIVLDSYKERSINNPYSCIIDSCEYICWNYRMAHKGNCRYCAERRKQEIKELIEELKQ